MNPKTPDGVPEKEWAKVTKLALAAAAASGKADDAAAADVTQKLLTMLEGLEQKFGPLPGILAARADFLDDPDEAVRLLERAYKIAGQRADVESRLTIADALAGCYIRELEDPKQGARWLAAMADALKQAGDENDVESYEELKARSRRAAARAARGRRVAGSNISGPSSGHRGLTASGIQSRDCSAGRPGAP